MTTAEEKKFEALTALETYLYIHYRELRPFPARLAAWALLALQKAETYLPASLTRKDELRKLVDNADSFAYCPECQVKVAPCRIMFEELHDTCGHTVVYVEDGSAIAALIQQNTELWDERQNLYAEVFPAMERIAQTVENLETCQTSEILTTYKELTAAVKAFRKVKP